MKALVYTGSGTEVSEVAEPVVKEDTDAVVRIRMSALGNTEALFASEPGLGLAPGTVVGHQAVGEVVEVGDGVHTVAAGDRVVIAATVACGSCAYCKVGFYAQCVAVNPRGLGTGGAYLGGPALEQSFDGTTAPKIRVPFADVSVRRVPDSVSDVAALHVSEEFAVGYFGAKLARICAGDRVAVLGSSPAAPFAAFVAKLLGAGRVLLVDDDDRRLAAAAGVGAEAIQADHNSIADAVSDATGGRGVQCCVVTDGLGACLEEKIAAAVLAQATASLSRDSTLSVVGVYPSAFDRFPIGAATAKYVTIKAAACNHAKYLTPLLAMLEMGVLDRTGLLQAAPDPITVDAVAELAPRAGWRVVGW